MNEGEYYRRVAGLIDPARLRSRRLAVVGLGSGGSRVAVELGRLGVRLLLIERPGERLREHNIVRHVLGYRSLGRPKLTETARRIRESNPSARVTVCALNVVSEFDRFAHLLRRWKPHAIAACTDNEASKHAISEAAVRLGIPQSGAGVYDGGVGGEIYWVRPGGACYGCIAAQLHPERQQMNRMRSEPRPQDRGSSPAIKSGLPPCEFPGSDTTEAYGNPDMEEGRITSALNLDIQQIALLHARITLDLLLDPEAGSSGLPPEVNLCVFPNRVIPGVFDRPWHARFYNLPRRPDCMCCGNVPGGLEAEADRILENLKAPRNASNLAPLP